MKRKKRSREEMDRLIADFEGRAAWLETAWACRTEYEIDTTTGAVWLKITMPANSTALVVRCDIAGVTVPGSDSQNTNCPNSRRP